MGNDHAAAFGKSVQRYFQDYLPQLRGMSIHTIRSYRDAMILFLGFVSSETSRPVERLDIRDLDRDRVMRFLKNLEDVRGNGIATRNARLAALHIFARFLSAECPEHLATLQSVLAIPFKRGGREVPIDYFESDEMSELLKAIDQSTDSGKRDYVLFSLLFNTGARVQEILDLKISDVRLESPCQVRLNGKGKKVRLCPIWTGTADLMREHIKQILTSDTETQGRLSCFATNVVDN